MTYNGPPGQPPVPPPPGGYGGPPPAGGYGGPPPVGGTAKFDPKTVNTLDWGILAAGVLSLIFSFFSYYSYEPTGDLKRACSTSAANIPSDVCDGVGNSAWHGFFGWFGVLLALVGAVLVAVALFAPAIRLPVPVRLAALGAFALAVISTLLALLVVPDGSYEGATISTDDPNVDAGHGFSYWVVLVLIVGGLVLAFLRFQQTGGQLSGRDTGSGAGPGAPPASQGYPQQGYPQQGYGQPGYQPPQAPPPVQPGYAPPQQPGYAPTQQPGYAPPPQPGYAPPQPQPGYPPAQPPPPAPPQTPPQTPPQGYPPPPQQQ